MTEAPDRQTWDFHLSPDGESVAYHLERTLGSVIRAYDLPDEGGAGRQ